MKLLTTTLTLVLAASVFARAQSKRSIQVTVKDTTIEQRDTVPGKPVVTYHQVTVDGKTINYKATAGYMPMRDKDDNKLLAKIFYVAYTATNSGEPKEKRPVTFVFNGGPGSASIWLHMGAISPVRVKFGDDKGDAAGAPYEYGENPNTWLAWL